MRVFSATLVSVIAIGAVAVLAGCAGGSGTPSGSTSLPSSPGAQSTVRSSAQHQSGIAAKFYNAVHFGHVLPTLEPAKGGIPKELAVSDFGTGAVEILNSSYQLTATITDGLVSPDGDAIDTKGNLYVANYYGPFVIEYPKGKTSPSTTYSTGLIDPIDVATDYSDNVYVADYGDGSPSSVFEYAQGSNTLLNQCAPGGGVEGVALDSKGDVFVSFSNANTGRGNLAEYVGGLTGCNETVLQPTLGAAGGLVVDKKGNLLACDQSVGVDVIPPPYTSIKSTITGFSDAFHIALNKKSSILYVADPGNADVAVVSYPSGSLITTLGSASGLSDPAGVAAFPVPKARK